MVLIVVKFAFLCNEGSLELLVNFNWLSTLRMRQWNLRGLIFGNLWGLVAGIWEDSKWSVIIVRCRIYLRSFLCCFYDKVTALRRSILNLYRFIWIFSRTFDLYWGLFGMQISERHWYRLISNWWAWKHTGSKSWVVHNLKNRWLFFWAGIFIIWN